ncbi:MAG: DUF86 domain-containing protein [Candidatus Parcubacteria bacterium]|nr:DUF86 domain-containing protein [Burkholderiales bacterium]
MANDDRDTALLLDMLSYAQEAAEIVDGLSYEGYAGDRLRVRALERVLEVVGEAARHISQARKDALTGIPWKLINGQRNALAHMYGDIDQFQLFRTASEDVPRLIVQLRKVSG